MRDGSENREEGKEDIEDYGHGGGDKDGKPYFSPGDEKQRGWWDRRKGDSSQLDERTKYCFSIFQIWRRNTKKLQNSDAKGNSTTN